MNRFVWFAGLLVLGAVWWGPRSAEAVILINEVLADPSAIFGDANGDGVISTTQDEFVELVNTGSDPVSLTGWTLSDLIQVRHVFANPTTIAGLGFFVVFGGGSPQGFADATTASSGSLGLNNTGDTITLQDALSLPIDIFTYGAAGGQDVSLTRFPDASGGFVQHSAVSNSLFSPGTTVDGLRALPHDSARPPTIPEPSTLFLLGLGLCGLPKKWGRFPFSKHRDI